MMPRIEFPERIDESLNKELRIVDKSKRQFLHIGLHNSPNKNSGDTLLFPAVRRLIDRCIPNVEWNYQQLWQDFGEREVQFVNECMDAIVIGGGGLFLKNQEGADVSKSGWQWNCSLEILKKLEKPIIFFAVGYNRFRNQEDFGPIFKEHVNLVFKKSPFFSLRNHGSIVAFQSYIAGTEDKSRILRQYCPTTVATQIFDHSETNSYDFNLDTKKKYLAFNCAFDRTDNRFGPDVDERLRKLARCMKSAENQGWTIISVAHKHIDLQMEEYLRDAEVSFKSVDLTNAMPNEILSFYNAIDLAVGLRGHAQLIPFGLRKPIISIISHEKMRFLLEDIDRLNWGIDIEDKNFDQALTNKTSEFMNDYEAILDSVANAQEKVWAESLENMQELSKLV